MENKYELFSVFFFNKWLVHHKGVIFSQIAVVHHIPRCIEYLPVQDVMPDISAPDFMGYPMLFFVDGIGKWGLQRTPDSPVEIVIFYKKFKLIKA